MGKTDIETNIDISILQRMPTLDKEGVVLEIQPLAPLSMVSELPGSYYKTLKMPDKKMLCGLFENVLGWHISIADRLQICKEIKKYRKNIEKQRNKHINSLFEPEIQSVAYTDYSKGSTFQPLLMDYFAIQSVKPVVSSVVFYDDLWSRAYRRSDSHKHTNGTRWMDSEFISKWSRIKSSVEKDTKRNSKQKNTLLDNLFKRYAGKFPIYYSTPTSREYIALEGKYAIELKFNTDLYAMIRTRIVMNNLCYLGNSEGWVDLKLKTI